MRFEHVIRAEHLEALSPDDRERFEERDRALEEYVSAYSYLWHAPSPLTTDISPRITTRFGGTMRKVSATLDVAGSTDTVIAIYRNASVVATVTITAGANTAETLTRVDFGLTDYLQVAVVTIGTDADRAEVQADFV